MVLPFHRTPVEVDKDANSQSDFEPVAQALCGVEGATADEIRRHLLRRRCDLLGIQLAEIFTAHGANRCECRVCAIYCTRPREPTSPPPCRSQTSSTQMANCSGSFLTATASAASSCLRLLGSAPQRRSTMRSHAPRVPAWEPTSPLHAHT